MKILNICSLLGALFFSRYALADQQVVQFYGFTYDNTFVADDMEYKTTNFTVVQNYGNEDERLFIGSLSEGDWLLVTYDVVGVSKQWIVSKIEILSDEFVDEISDSPIFDE